MDKKYIKNLGEISYVLATLLMALGTVFCIKADLGMSMIAAPAYCISQWIGDLMGFGEYIFQGVLLVIFCVIVRKFKWQYMLSFFTAFLYGSTVNLFELILNDVTFSELYVRIPLFVVGMVLVSFSVALYFNTYLPLAVYELFVAGISEKFSFSVGKTKSVYDFSSFLASVILSLAVFGVFGEGDMRSLGGIIDILRRGGVYIGTLVITVFNSVLITCFNKLLRKHFSFEPMLPRLYRFLKA